MEIKPTSPTPIRQLPYRQSQSDRGRIQKEIQEIMAAGVFRPSDSPWSSPVVMVKKKDGTPRFCVNYRKFNSITIADPFPFHRLEDIFDELSGSEFFTCLDAKSGYWQEALA